MHASAVAFSIIKWLGVAYLLYLAWKTFRDKSVFAIDSEPVKPSPWRVIMSGILVNTLNPKLTIFFFAFLPSSSRRSAGAVPLMVYLSAIFMAVTLVVFAFDGVFAAAVRIEGVHPAPHRGVGAPQLRRHRPGARGQLAAQTR